MSEEQRGRLHPRKLMMYISMASMFMVFAGLTSAFILMKGKSRLADYHLPSAFWISTILILASSFTMNKIVQAFKDRNRVQYKRYTSITIVLGIAFIIFQLIGFNQLYNEDVKLDGNAAGGFLYIITGLHGVHVLGAVVALVIVYLTAFRKKVKVYSVVNHEIMSIFWHFVDGLWIYLLLFFLINFKIA